MNQGGTQQQGEELVNSTLFQFFENIAVKKSYTENNKMVAYCMKIAIYTWYNWYDQQQQVSRLKNQLLQDLPLSITIEEQNNLYEYAIHEQINLLYRSIEQLNPVEQMVVQLRLKEFSHKTIAQELNKTESNIKMIFYRAKNKLKKIMLPQMESLQHY